jgi:NitT/TauT family transport system substrate-binding protein
MWYILSSVLALFAGCLPQPTQAAEPVNLHLAWVTIGVDYPLPLLKAPGLPLHLGKTYTIDSTHFTNTPAMITALAADQIDLAPLAFSAFSLAIENAGMTDLRAIADAFQDGVTGYHSTEFMVLDAGNIRKIEDLKGKILTTNAMGSGVDIAMRAMLRKHGLDDKHDVTIIEAAFPNMQAMLVDHKADLIIGIPPFSYDPALRNVARTLFTVRDAVGPTQFVIWTAKAGTLQKYRAAIVDYLEDSLRVLHWTTDPATHDQAIAQLAELAKRPADSFRWLYTKEDEYHAPDGLPDIASLTNIIDAQYDAGFLKTKLDASRYADTSLVKEAAARIK